MISKMRSFFGWGFFIYLTVYLMLSTPVFSEFLWCEEWVDVEGGDPIVEYCVNPINVGMDFFVLYAFMGEASEIELELYSDPGFSNPANCNLLDPLQVEGGATLTSPSKLTISANGAYALSCSNSVLELKSPGDVVRLGRHENCPNLVRDRAFLEEYLDFVSFERADEGNQRDIDEIKAALDYLEALGAASGLSVMCSADKSCSTPEGETGSSAQTDCTEGEDPDFPVRKDCGSSGGNLPTGYKCEYPSFYIVDPTADEITQYNLGSDYQKKIKRFLIEIKSGELAGHRFILEYDYHIFPHSYVRLYTLDGSYVGIREYNIIMGGVNKGETIAIEIKDDAFKGKGLASVLEEYTFNDMLNKGVTEITTGTVMAFGPNPYVAKTLKNLGFEPDVIFPYNADNMIEYIDLATDIDIKLKYSETYGYYHLEYTGDMPTAGIVEENYIFFEDEAGRFIEGDDFYIETFFEDELGMVQKPLAEIKQALKDLEAQKRSLWGRLPYKLENEKIPLLKSKVTPTCVGGGCARYPTTFPSRESFNLRDAQGNLVYDNEGNIKNFIEVIENKVLPEAIEQMNAKGITGDAAVNVMGSNTYFYEMRNGVPSIRYDAVGDLDYYIIFSDDMPESRHGEAQGIIDGIMRSKMKEFYGKDITTQVIVGESLTKTMEYYDNDIRLLLYDVFKGIYIGSSNMIVDINTGLDQLAGSVPSGTLKFWSTEWLNEAKERAAAGTPEGYDRASKKLMQIAHMFDEPEQVTDMVRSYISQGASKTYTDFLPKIEYLVSTLELEGCARYIDIFEEKSWDIRNSEGDYKGNLIAETKDILAKVKQSQSIEGELSIGYTGSATHFFRLEDGIPQIQFDYVNDLDYSVYYSQEVPSSKYPQIEAEIKNLMQDMVSRVFEGRPVGIQPLGTGRPNDLISLTSLFFSLDQKALFVGSDDSIIGEIDTRIAEIEASNPTDLLNKKISQLSDQIKSAESYADSGDYDKAVKRLSSASHILDEKDLTSDMVDTYITESPQKAYTDFLPILQDKIFDLGVGGCARYVDIFEDKSFDVRDAEGKYKGNLLTETKQLISDVEGWMKTEGIEGEIAIGYRGSPTYFYKLVDGKPQIQMQYINDIECALLFSDDVPDNTNIWAQIEDKVMEGLKDINARLFDNRLTGTEITYKGRVSGVIAPTRNFITYNQRAVYVALKEELIDEIDRTIKGIESRDPPELIGWKQEKIDELITEAKNRAASGEYDKALKRLAQITHLLDNTEKTSDIVTDFVDSYPNLQSVYDKYLPEVESLIGILDTAEVFLKIRRRVQAYEELNEIVRKLQDEYYMEETVDVGGLEGLETEINDIMARLEQDLTEAADRQLVEDYVNNYLRDYIDYLKSNPSLDDTVAKERMSRFNTLTEVLKDKIYEDYKTLLDFGKPLKEAFDAAGLDATAEIKSAEDAYVKAVEANNEAAKKLNKWHESKYQKDYVSKARGESFEKLKDIGKSASKYTKYVEMPVLVLSVLGMEVGERLQAAAYEETDPYLTKLGNMLYLGGFILALPISAHLIYSAVSAIVAMQLGSLLGIAVDVAICAFVIGLIINIVDYLICEQSWSKSVMLGTYSVYQLFCTEKSGPMILIELRDSGGAVLCNYINTWSGETEISCG